MKEFRVWEGSSSLCSCNYKDVKGKDYMTVARRFFGRSKNMKLHHDDTGTAAVTINGSVQGYVRQFD